MSEASLECPSSGHDGTKQFLFLDRTPPKAIVQCVDLATFPRCSASSATNPRKIAPKRNGRSLLKFREAEDLLVDSVVGAHGHRPNDEGCRVELARAPLAS
jgi:hypothetical protein